MTFVPGGRLGVSPQASASATPHYPRVSRDGDGRAQGRQIHGPHSTIDGDANKLLEQIETTSEALNRGRGVHVAGAHTTIVTDQGRQGATARVTGPHTGGVIAAFVFDGRGVEAVATGTFPIPARTPRPAFSG